MFEKGYIWLYEQQQQKKKEGTLNPVSGSIFSKLAIIRFKYLGDAASAPAQEWKPTWCIKDFIVTKTSNSPLFPISFITFGRGRNEVSWGEEGGRKLRRGSYCGQGGMESGNVGLHQISVEDDVNLLHRSLHHLLRNFETEESSCGILEAGICLGHLVFSVGTVLHRHDHCYLIKFL